MQTFGTRLRRARDRAGVTQQVVAEAAGITAQNYALYEQGRRVAGAERTALFARVLGVSTDWLITGQGRMARR